jgi:hypothetical protein
MAANTGPDVNTYAIPEVELGDTFNVWKDITNTGIYKLNQLRVYEGVSSSDITASTDSSGNLSMLLADTVPTGHTFSGQMAFTNQVAFGSGVTFNGPVTFNADTFTVNAKVVTIDDYNIILGDTGAASDSNISTAGGGGLLLNRGSGNTAEWLWTPTLLHGFTGVWTSNGHIGFKGNTSGLYPTSGGNLLVHGTGIRLDGSGTTEHGLLVNFAGSGTTTGRTIEMARYSPAGSTGFIDVALRTPPNSLGSRPYVTVKDGVNKKSVYQINHLFQVGTPVRIDATGVYAAAQADNPENAEVIGVVSRVVDGNNFELTFMGEIFDINFSAVNSDGSANGITGAVYYLSPYTAGKISTSYPTLVNTVHKAVFIATSSSSGVVVPWTGGVISDSVVLGESTSNTVKIEQLNQFRPGDVVRFKSAASFGGSVPYASASGVTLTYGATSGFYNYGVYVRADSKDSENADNVAGVVISTQQLSGVAGVKESFNLMMDGFFSVPAGVSAVNNGTPGSLVTGTNYFLNINCAGTTGSFEGSTACLTNTPPTATNSVNKPVLFATSPTTGYVYSYRGTQTTYTTNPNQIDVAQMLIQDIRSSQNSSLKFGVYDGGAAGGRQVMEFDHVAKGNVRIGPSTFISSSVGAGATLSVFGTVVSGNEEATNGSVILASRYNSSYPTTLNVFGSMNSTGNSVVAYGVRPKAGAVNTYQSTTVQNIARTAIEVGVDTDDPSFRLLGLSRRVSALGSDLSLPELFKVSGSTATFAGFVSAAAGVSGPTFYGNATTASALRTSRTIALSGEVNATGVAFDGSGNITLNTTIAANSIINADIVDGTITDAKLATISTAGKVSNSATTAASANTANAIVARDSSGNFSVGTISTTTNPSAADHLTRKGYVDGFAPKVIATLAGSATAPFISVLRAKYNDWSGTAITVTRTAVGTYVINFPVGMFNDVNYTIVGSVSSSANNDFWHQIRTTSTTSATVLTGYVGGSSTALADIGTGRINIVVYP